MTKKHSNLLNYKSESFSGIIVKVYCEKCKKKENGATTFTMTTIVLMTLSVTVHKVALVNHKCHDKCSYLAQNIG